MLKEVTVCSQSTKSITNKSQNTRRVTLCHVNDVVGFREENHKGKEEEGPRKAKAWRD